MSKLEKKFYGFAKDFLSKPYFTIPNFFFLSILLLVDSSTVRLIVIIISLLFTFVVKPDMLRKISELEKEL